MSGNVGGAIQAITPFQPPDMLGQAGQMDESIAQFHLAIDQRPEYAEAHNNLGSALFAEQKLPDAVVEFKAAIAANPDFAEAHNNLGYAYAAAGNADDAIRLAETTSCST